MNFFTKFVFCLFIFLNQMMFANESSGKIYINTQDFFITDRGIFLNEGVQNIPVSSLHFDGNRFYVASEEFFGELWICDRCGAENTERNAECWNCHKSRY